MATYHILSLKQPWATLLSAGRKSIEVRRWQTAYRGLVLIHAARVPDSRPQAWGYVSPDLRARANEAGGIVGAGVLSSVRLYSRADLFAAEQSSHLNDPSWFEPAGLFGLCFTDLRPVPFFRLPGQVRLFQRDLDGFHLPPPAGPPPSPPADAPARRWQRILRSLLGPGPPSPADRERR